METRAKEIQIDEILAPGELSKAEKERAAGPVPEFSTPATLNTLTINGHIVSVHLVAGMRAGQIIKKVIDGFYGY